MLKITATLKTLSVSSPTVVLYFSPSQLENLIEVTDYDSILEQVKALEKAAYEW